MLGVQSAPYFNTAVAFIQQTVAWLFSQNLLNGGSCCSIRNNGTWCKNAIQVPIAREIRQTFNAIIYTLLRDTLTTLE